MTTVPGGAWKVCVSVSVSVGVSVCEWVSVRVSVRVSVSVSVSVSECVWGRREGCDEELTLCVGRVGKRVSRV